MFSVGVIAHLLFLNRSVFSGKKYNEVLAQNRACDFNFNKPEYSEIPGNVCTLLFSML